MNIACHLAVDSPSSIAMDETSLSEEIPDSAVEHSCVEVDAIVPFEEHKLLLMVDNLLIVCIVLCNDVFPVAQIEEVVGLVDHFVEEVLGVTAVNHRLAEKILRTFHHLVSILVFLVVVVTKSIFQLVIEIVSLVGALNDVVSVILHLILVGIEETSVPLSGGVFGQIRAVLHN